MTHPLHCRCGALQGVLTPSASATRAICYCNDCQAYARFLGTAGIVDEKGGTEVIASLPRYLRLTAGLDKLACLSLRPRGLLRWYASCCGTPIGNTPRNPKVPYVGVVHSCLANVSPTLDESFGRSCIAVNTKSATAPVRATPLSSTAAVVKLMASALGARVSGAYNENPFFEAGVPIRSEKVLSDAERELAYRGDR